MSTQHAKLQEVLEEFHTIMLVTQETPCALYCQSDGHRKAQ